MAMRYLARKVGIPGLRRTSEARVWQEARSRQLSSCSCQGGAKGVGKESDDVIARLKAAFEAQKFLLSTWKTDVEAMLSLEGALACGHQEHCP
ncbi:hypothetical protein EJB05_14420 [Eragrostis curvula]|uniref:Uncharacterized protein n=1 Tax=Eragrostis curvula TaxID=38414 RepID=A0A5J9VZ69_9POAL|nr:hypothetical protein EJB05_14420 [Eragrostis curvula]